MKKFLTAGALVASLFLGGCAGGSVEKFSNTLQAAVTLTTVGVQNPVGTKEMAALEAGYRTAVVGAVNYRRHYLRNPCAEGTGPTLTDPCAQYEVVIRLQDYGLRARLAMQEVRRFRRENPRLNASDVYNEALRAVNTYRQITGV